MIAKIFSGFSVLVLLVTACFQTAYAEDIITNRTGTIKLTKPDRTVLTIAKGELLPDISSGSTVELLDGCMDVAPAEGSVQVIAGNSAATVETGDRVTLCINNKTGMADFTVHTGKIEIASREMTGHLPSHPSLLHEEPLEPEKPEGSPDKPEKP